MTLHFKGWDQIDGSIVSGKQADIAYTKVMKRAKDMERAGKWYNGVFGKVALYGSIAAACMILGIFTGKTVLSTDNEGASQCTIIADNGQKSEAILPDGSRVKLNSATRISWSDNFGKSDRNIELNGEAFFEVAKNKDLPFIVKTSSGISVEALGTKFNVRSYDNENETVTLVEGKVLAKSGNVEAILHPHQSISCERATGTFGKVKYTDLNSEIPWMSGMVEFNDTPLWSIAIQIERMYNMAVSFENESIRNFRYTGIISNASLPTLLDIMSETSPVSYKIKENQIIFSKK